MNWKPIKGYEGLYEISDNGDVKSLDRIVTLSNGCAKHVGSRMMKLTLSKGRGGEGYYVVNLHKNGIGKLQFVHRLVAEAFIPNPNSLPTVNHIDGNKTNNAVNNLEWTSFPENNTHALDMKLRLPRGTKVVQKTSEGEVVNIYKSTCEASRTTGIGRGSISHCINHRSNHAGGYIWERYLEGVTTIPLGSTPEDELPVEVQGQHS